jgi:Domain of unknown function (DUF4258)
MTGAEALDRIKEAVRSGRYFIHPHCRRRMGSRAFDLYDVKHALSHARRAEPYVDSDRAPPAGTTLWRVFGVDREGDELRLGVDLTIDHLGNAIVVTTAF